MADYVEVQKGAHKLTVSRKAFNSIYKEKGFELAGGKQQAKTEESGPSRKAGSKAASKKSRAGSKSKRSQSADSKAADAENGGATGLPDGEEAEG